MNVGFVGTGTIASAMIHALAEDNYQIWTSERNTKISAELRQKFPCVSVGDNQTVIDNCEIVIVCLVANTARNVLPTLHFHQDQRVLSVMVGMNLQELAANVSPATVEAVFIPYAFIRYGESPLLVYPESEAVKRLFGRRNTLMVLNSEEDLKYMLVGQAVLSPIIKLLEETSTWINTKIVNRNLSEKFLRVLVGRALACDSSENTGTLSEILHDLATEGGLNQQLYQYMDKHNVYERFTQGLNDLEKNLS